MPREKSYNRLFTGKLSVATFLQVYALYLLSKGDKMCGKEICTKIETRFKGTWSPSHGMIYPLLRDMEAQGLVKARWENRTKKTKRLYWITEDGKEVLAKQLEEHEGMFKEVLGMMAILVSDLYSDDRAI